MCMLCYVMLSSMTSNEYMYNIYLEDFLFVTDMPWNFFAHFCFCFFVFLFSFFFGQQYLLENKPFQNLSVYSVALYM